MVPGGKGEAADIPACSNPVSGFTGNRDLTIPFCEIIVCTSMEKIPTEHLLNHCLFFTTGKLNRLLAKWAEQEFALTGLPPSGAFAVMVLCDRPGMSQTELAGILHLDPSTLTRFMDRLEEMGLVKRRKEGRMTMLEPTPKGRDLWPALDAGWKRIWKKYTDVLGTETGNDLAARIHQAALKLES